MIVVARGFCLKISQLVAQSPKLHGWICFKKTLLVLRKSTHKTHLCWLLLPVYTSDRKGVRHTNPLTSPSKRGEKKKEIFLVPLLQADIGREREREREGERRWNFSILFSLSPLLPWRGAEKAKSRRGQISWNHHDFPFKKPFLQVKLWKEIKIPSILATTILLNSPLLHSPWRKKKKKGRVSEGDLSIPHYCQLPAPSLLLYPLSSLGLSLTRISPQEKKGNEEIKLLSLSFWHCCSLEQRISEMPGKKRGIVEVYPWFRSRTYFYLFFVLMLSFFFFLFGMYSRWFVGIWHLVWLNRLGYDLHSPPILKSWSTINRLSTLNCPSLLSSSSVHSPCIPPH